MCFWVTLTRLDKFTYRLSLTRLSRFVRKTSTHGLEEYKLWFDVLISFYFQNISLKMVSHFGEVIFPSSRAFWNDEDEYEPANNTEHCPWVQIMWSHIVIIRLSFNSLIIRREIIQNNDFRKLYVRWLKTKPKRIQKFIIMEGDPLIRNINTF